MLRITVDTNTLISGTMWRGKPGEIVRLIAGESVRLVTSESLLAELGDVLTRPEFRVRLASQSLTSKAVLASFRQCAELATPDKIPATSRDPDDDAVLAVALAAKVDAIVTGDFDLRMLKAFHGIPIFNAAEFLDFYARQPR